MSAQFGLRWSDLTRQVNPCEHILSMTARVLALVLLLASLALPASALAQAPSQLQAGAQRLDQLAREVASAAGRSDWTVARREWRQLGEVWLDVEDPFRDASRDAYTDIEAQMVAVADALKPEPPDRAAVEAELAALRALLAPFASGQIAAGAPAGSASAQSLGDLMATLDRAIASARANEAAAALAATRQFQTEWLDVEGLVKTRSPAVYRSTEDGMAEAAAQLRANPPRAAEAAAVLERMRADLAPIAAG